MELSDKSGADKLATWSAESDELARQTWSGVSAAGQGLALRMGAAISLAELLFDALPSGAADIERRCLNSDSPGSRPSEAMFRAEAAAVGAKNGDEPSLPERVGADNAEPLGLYGKGLIALLEGCSGEDRSKILKVASDYVWRGYCVRFHIPEDQRAEFPTGDPLLNWSHVNALYSKARFAPGAQMVSFKKTLALAINNAAAEGPAPAEDRSSLINGLSCVYLYDIQQFDESSMKWAGASPDGVEQNRNGGASLASLRINPLAAFFAHELQTSYGIPSLAPDVPAAPGRGKLESWRAKSEAAKDPAPPSVAPKGVV